MRTDSRKSRARGPLAALLFLTATTAGAQIQHHTTVVSLENRLEISITATGADVDDLFANLHDGMRARIEYLIRIAVPRRRPFRMLGDRLLEEFRPSFDVRWDPFLSRYVVEESDGDVVTYDNEAGMFAGFFSLEGFSVPRDARDDDPMVVETSVRYTPIVFVPGLSILSLFTHSRTRTSAWLRQDVDQETNGP